MTKSILFKYTNNAFDHFKKRLFCQPETFALKEVKEGLEVTFEESDETWGHLQTHSFDFLIEEQLRTVLHRYLKPYGYQESFEDRYILQMYDNDIMSNPWWMKETQKDFYDYLKKQANTALPVNLAAFMNFNMKKERTVLEEIAESLEIKIYEEVAEYILTTFVNKSKNMPNPNTEAEPVTEVWVEAGENDIFSVRIGEVDYIDFSRYEEVLQLSIFNRIYKDDSIRIPLIQHLAMTVFFTSIYDIKKINVTSELHETQFRYFLSTFNIPAQVVLIEEAAAL